MIWNPLQWSRWVQGASLFALIVIGVLAWLHFHDKRVIDDHERGIADQVTTATEAANATANANDTVRQAENARADEQLRGAISDAQEQHPEEARKPAGPAVSGTLDRLRKRQAETGSSTR